MVPLATPASSAISCMVAAFIPLRAMTRMAASRMDWMRNSWTTSSLDRAMVHAAERTVSESEFPVSRCDEAVTDALRYKGAVGYAIFDSIADSVNPILALLAIVAA